MSSSPTRGAPEWRGQVGFFNGRRWFEFTVVGVFAHQQHVAASRAVTKAKRDLRRGMHIEQVKISLTRFKGISDGVAD